MTKRVDTPLFKLNRKILLYQRKEACVQCESKVRRQVDHIVPVAEGGSDELDNLQVLCFKCHKKKTAKQVNGPGYEKAQVMRAIHSKAGMKWWLFAKKTRKKSSSKT